MDTRFWGPSGWECLHQITFAYEPEQKQTVKELFEMLPFVLPCKFCRASLTTYMKSDPIDLTSRDALSRWLWRIHNAVNDKLRKQGQDVAPDPTFESVKTYYTDSLASGCTQTHFPGWTFLFSIAENHPLCKESRKTTPLPDAPPRSPGMTDEDLNEWNLLQPEERVPYYRRFWAAIWGSLPYHEWRSIWEKEARKVGLLKHTGNRWALLKALWRLRCTMESELELQNRTRFADLCRTLANHRSGCAKSKRAITCRKRSRGTNKKTLKK